MTTTGPLRVLHLAGSAVSDLYADLSRLYAADCLAATADAERYEFHVAYVTPDGRWRFPADLSPAALAASTPYAFADAVATLVGVAPDVVVPQMFCRPGMTAYRAVFDVLDIPYVGNTATVMAIGADKAKTKAIVAAAGVDVPAGEVLRRGEVPTLAPPVVVKPADADNSLGLALVRHRGEYAAALRDAFAHADAVIVEEYVELGREVRCGVLDRDGELVCLPLEEYAVDPVTKPVRDHADKIRRTPSGELQLVAKDATYAWIVDPDDPVCAAVHAAARTAHVALGCRGYSLFDFRIDADGRPWFLEAGLYCSFARQSVVAVMAAAAGIPIEQLFGDAVSRASRRPAAPGPPTRRSPGPSAVPRA